MKDNLAKEALKRSLLLMKYDTSKTLTENEVKTNKRLLMEGPEESIRKVLGACANRPAREGTLNDAEIAGGFNQAFNYEVLGFLGIPGGTDDSKETGWRKYAEMMKVGNLDDLCNINNRFKEAGYGEFASEIIDDLDDEEMSELVTVFDMMKRKTDKEARLSVDNTEQMTIDFWKKQYSCVFVNGDNVDSQPRQDRNNQVYILVKGSSGDVYRLYTEGRLKKDSSTDEKLLPVRLKCANDGSTVVESVLSKKKHLREFDDTKIKNPNKPSPTPTGGGGGGGGGGATYDQSVANLQQQLLNYGFYLGTSGPKKDGVDGIRGSKTNAAQQAFSNGEKCGDYNKKNNYPNPATCKDGGDGGTPKPQDQEIKMIDPSTF